jgi:hypothetical protein
MDCWDSYGYQIRTLGAKCPNMGGVLIIRITSCINQISECLDNGYVESWFRSTGYVESWFHSTGLASEFDYEGKS